MEDVGMLYLHTYGWPFGLFYGQLVCFSRFFIFSRFGLLYREKSGNPDLDKSLKDLKVAPKKLNFLTFKKRSVACYLLPKYFKPHIGILLFISIVNSIAFVLYLLNPK
jgi:hypothetical protein